MSTAPPAIDQQYEAKLLYWQGWRIVDIAKRLAIRPGTVYSWKHRGDWDGTPVAKRVETALDARLVQLIGKDEKTVGDLQEIEVLTKALERTARVRKFDRGGNEADLNPRRSRKGKGGKKKNEITQEQAEKLIKAFKEGLFGYQEQWRVAGRTQRVRNILKSRQIGATWYFAREAFADGLETGRNQIFLSASKAQAHVFKAYILAWVELELDIQLAGDPITVNGPNGKFTLYFLGTNFRTAQSYHGNVYLDEYFWILNFQAFRKVASGMAMHKKWRLTYFSTPSTLNHEAHPFWSGEQFNQGRPVDQRIQIDVSHQALKDGRLCEDGQWRQIVTVEDAVASGCDLFDIDQLRLEYSESEFRNLLMCEFVDDTASVFTMAMLAPCQVDAWEEWADFRPFAPRPIGQAPVWIGYDPSRTRDGAGVIVVAPPQKDGDDYRVLDRIRWNNLQFHVQAERIKALCQAYNVQHLEVDCTGPGAMAVAELVEDFYPGLARVTYSPAVKSMMVAKAVHIINNGRLKYDGGGKELTMALMGIRKAVTAGGTAITYTSGRSEDVGHGDLAWALLHALNKSEIKAGGDAGGGNILEIF